MHLLTPSWTRGYAFALALFLVQANAPAQIYVEEGGPPSTSGISEYSLSGSLIESNLIPEDFPQGMVVYGNVIYAVNEPSNANSGTLSSYNATTGAVINPSLVTDLGSENYLGVSSNNLYDGYYGGITVFNATSGTVLTSYSTEGLLATFAVAGNIIYAVEENINLSGYNVFALNASTGDQIGSSPLISGLPDPGIPVISGNNLYIESQGPVVNGYYTAGYINEYNATTGQVTNAELVKGLDDPTNLSLVGNDLFVVTTVNNTRELEEFDTSGNLVSSDVIPNGLGEELVVNVVPEPATYILMLVGLAALAGCVRRKLT